MPIELMGLLEDVETFEGKSGFGANVTISTKVEKKTKRVTFMTRSKEVVSKLELLLDTDVIVKIQLNQNNFGLRFGDVIEVGA
jgi:hypothetical protein